MAKQRTQSNPINMLNEVTRGVYLKFGQLEAPENNEIDPLLKFRKNY
jgi:hypothetical protein